MKIAEILELPKPDTIFYLKVSPEISIKRKTKEKGIKNGLDRNESDKKLLINLISSYNKLIRNQVFGKWVVVDGERPIKEVSEKIKKFLL